MCAYGVAVTNFNTSQSLKSAVGLLLGYENNTGRSSARAQSYYIVQSHLQNALILVEQNACVY